MNKMREYERGREDGLSLALRIAKEGGIEAHWCDNHYGYLEWEKYSDGRGGSSQYKVIAWQPIVPYRPERRDAVERESNNL